MDKKNIPEITDEQVQECIVWLTKFEQTLENVLHTLSAEQRLHSRKMGDASVEFVNKCTRATEAALEHFPANYDLPNIKKANVLYDKLQPILVKEQMVQEKLNDTMMFIKDFIMTSAEDSYSILKRASKHDASVKTLVDDIAKHYKKNTTAKKKKPTEE